MCSMGRSGHSIAREKHMYYAIRIKFRFPTTHLLPQFLQVNPLSSGKLHARRLCGVHVPPYRFKRHSVRLTKQKVRASV